MTVTFNAPATPGGNSSVSDFDDWYKQYVADIIDLGRTMAQEDYQPYGGPRIADWTPDQDAAFASMRDAQGMWRPYVDPAQDALTAAQGGLNSMANMTEGAGRFNRYAAGQIDPTTGQAYQNTDLAPVGAPGQMSYAQFNDVYQQPLEGMQRAIDQIGQRNFTNTTLKNLNDSFTGTGQFGSSRNQILGADAAAMAQTQIEEAKATAAMQAATNAMGDYGKWNQQQGQMGAQMGQYASNQSKLGTDLMNFGVGTQGLAMGDASAMMNIGTQQQGMDQRNLDLAYSDYSQQEAYPWQQLDRWTALLRNQTIPHYTMSSGTTGASNGGFTVGGSSGTMQTQNPWAVGIQGAGGVGSWFNSAFS